VDRLQRTRTRVLLQADIPEQLKSCWILCLLGFFSLLMPCAAVAGYIVQRGDILEITVPGVPGLHRRAPIDAGGQLSVPVIGDIDAAGKSLAELRTTLRDLLLVKNVIRDPEVLIDVAEYRPVYVGGDVTKPGAYPYRPGMTVRDAVALAQGYDLLHLRGRDPVLEASKTRGDYESLAVELARLIVRVARLKAELGDREELDVNEFGSIPVKPDVMAEIAQLERQQLAADRVDSDREKTYLARMIKGTKDQLNALVHEQEQDAIALDQQRKNLARARDLMQRGLIQNARIEDLERVVAGAQSQTFQVQARAAQAQKDLEDFTKKLQTADDQRRIRLLQELRDAVTQSATARYRLEAAAENVRYTSAAKSQNPSAAPVDPPEVTIYRLVNNTQEQLKADEVASLDPGDNVEIVIKSQLDKLLNGSASTYLPVASAVAVPSVKPGKRK
jgi:polysaccharide export outer membrane protein